MTASTGLPESKTAEAEENKAELTCVQDCSRNSPMLELQAPLHKAVLVMKPSLHEVYLSVDTENNPWVLAQARAEVISSKPVKLEQ